MELHWHHVGPARPQGSEVPPIAKGNYDYALLYDAKRERIVYICPTEYHQPVHTWSWDGERWEHDDVELPEEGGSLTSDECHAYFDTRRGAVVLGSIEHVREIKRYVPTLVVVDASGPRTLQIAGEAPLIEPQDDDDTFFPSSQVGWIAAYDEARGVGVCCTRNGIWEIVDETWVKRCARPEAVAPDWHASPGSAWDPVGKRCVMWIQERGEDYGYRLWTWDGTTCTAISTDGLPDFEREAYALFVAHPRHGIVCSAGPHGMFALDGNAWRKLPEATNPPPFIGPRGQTGGSHLAYDPKRAAFVVGPGYHDGDPGGSDAQDVFYVMRDGAWEQHGAVAKYAEIHALSDNYKPAVVGGTWYALHHRELETWKWTDGGWACVVDKKTGDLPSDRLGAVAAGDALYAVTQKGAVYRLADDRWEQVAGASTAFKEREEFQLAHDGTRLVAWGGKVNNRKQNDTLVFEDGVWKAFKKASPKPADFNPPKYETVDFVTIFDAGTLVRFGHQEVAVLQGEVWTPYTPKGYATLCGRRDFNHLPAHDPVSGETLLIDFEQGHVVRFDLGACTVIAKLVWGPLEEDAKKFDTHLHRAYRHVFDPVTRSLQSQHPEDKWARYALDLVPAFEAAKAKGPRTKVEMPVEASKKKAKKK